MADIVPTDLKQRLKASYDAIAPKYNAWTIPNSSQRIEYLDKLLQLLTASDSIQDVSVLELGCGCGLPVTQKLLSHANFRVTANDLSSVQIESAKENLLTDEVADRLTFAEGDMTTLEFEVNSLDAVVGMYSLIHLPRAEQEALLGKIAKWLKPGGYLLANFSAEAVAGVEMDKWLDEKGWVYWSGYGAEETTLKVKQAGLDVIVSEVATDVVDASFLWVIAKKAV